MQSMARKALFDVLQFELKPDHVFLDLFGGSGGVGFEAYSRGVERVLVNEFDKANCEAIRKNAETFGVAPTFRVFNLDFRAMLDFCVRHGERLDFVFCAPPYAMKDYYTETLAFFREHPGTLSPGGQLIVETHKKAEHDWSGFEVRRDRTYGAARLVNLKPVARA
jgi:16S rRNA (guanine966-N2)-methyltransferase